MKKLVNYLPFVALFLLPLLFYPVVDTSSWRSSSDVHAMLEFASSLLAITAGIMVLLYFFTTGRSFFLIISIGFVLIGAEEFVHAIFSFNRIWVEIPTTFKLAISTTWLSGQFILVTSFFIALLSGERHVKAKRGLYAIVFNIIGVIFASSISLLIFNSPFLPDFVQLGSITKKMTELSLALLFFVAFIFYFRIYLKQQSHSSLLWGIIACIILRVLVHIFVFDSRTFYDSHWDTAHLIVLLSYFPPIFGVWGETIKLHRFSQLQVIELEKEMTERKQTEETLRESEEKFRNLFNNSEVGMFRTRLDGSEILEFNKKYLKILNYTFEEVKGSPSMNMWANKHEREKMVQLLKTEGHVTDFECELLNKQGDMINCVTSLRLYPDNGILEGSIQDITERKQAEEEIKNIKESLEMLNHRLEEIREDERALISRELHDQLGQSLTALKIDMNWLCGKIASDSEESAKLKRMIKLVTDTSKDVHRISTELRPAMLDDIGLCAAMEWYSEEFEKRTGINCLLKLDDVQFTNEKKSLAFYRILQEALTNVLRHAKAKNVTINLYHAEDSIILEVFDDGIGLDKKKIDSNKSLGFVGMRERIKQFNGRMDISSTLNKGTKLSITIPFN